ncbi:MAG: 3-phosphoglycerate dehydrogenase [Firmicutes bacterium]|nr:3-phosphoglycerate dehydrogenase [Bacillota bacterium]MBQ9605353.1 3-phosphoglycerate dehydrogenase [Bacillota bacterium]
MYNILTLNKISSVGLNELTADYNVSDDCKNPDGILLRSFKMHDMELPDSLKAVARCGAGVNNIPLDKCAEKGVVVFNTPGANANAVKELVLTGLLISSRKIVDGYNWAQTLKGTEGVAAAVEKGKAQFVGPEIYGKTLGIIGLGAIGVLVANAAVALGMKVYGYDPYLSVNAAWNLNSHVVKAKSMDEIFAVSDYITVHVPLTPDTKETFNAENLAKCKDGVRILNFSRGELANNKDMIAALESGKVARYVVDFPNEETVGVDGIITLPHLGASTPEAEDNCAAMAARELMDYLENGNITNSVNYPNCSAPRIAGHDRICILHKNVPKILSGATSLFSSKGLNINNMTNNAKGEYAYTIMDAQPIAEDITETLKAIDGVIAVRVIK